MKYYFILGNNPALSIAEINSLLGEEIVNKPNLLFDNILILEIGNLNPSEIIKRLGGTIKIGVVKEEVDKKESSIINSSEKIIGKKEGKIHFGFSFYGQRKMNLKKIGLETKKILSEKGMSCRWVTSREANLSSVVVSENKLLRENGAEIVIIETKENFLLGRTEAVQLFKELSFRDYGRPNRDDLSGMLPPKLAQIMINLAGASFEQTILDPFCGSGTIPTEASLMGYKNLIGTDISEKAIEDTKKNIEWINSKFQLPNFDYKLFNKSSTQLSEILKPNSIDAIITEPYLGPQRGKVEIEKIKKELEILYSLSLKEFYKILKPKGRVVMIWPVFHITHNAKHITQNITPNLEKFKIINPIPEKFRQNKDIKLTKRNTIVYGREGQKVFREIVVLEK